MKYFGVWSMALVLCVVSGSASALQTAQPSQTVQQTLAMVDTLPESPGALLQVAPQILTPELRGTARVEGVILDANNNPVPDAKVTLSARGRFEERSVTTGADGAFSFSDLPIEQFRLTIVAMSFESFTSPEFAVKAGQTVIAPRTSLKVSSISTSVDVVADSSQVAVAQVQEQEQQRVFGVFPNFYTSYIWKAEPMPTRLKYRLASRAIIDPFTLLIVAGVASAEHYNGTYPGYGPGIGGYGKRFGAAFGDALTSRIIGSAILPSVLHQDPRYFYQGSGSIASRSTHAVASTFITRGDNGKTQINFSHLMGSLAAGAIANAYHPASSRGLGLTFETFGISTGANALGNLFREFVLRGLEPSVPVFANGKH